MSAVEEATDALAEMGREQEAGEHAGAIASAKRLLGLIRELDNQRQRQILLNVATATLLTSQAVLDPGHEGLPSFSDSTFQRFRAFQFEGAARTAIIALGVKIQVLLHARDVQEATRSAEQLAAFYCSRPSGGEQVAEGDEVVRIASNMIAMRAPAAAAELLRSVVARLSDAPEPQSSRLAAMAQSWVVIALMFTGEPDPDAPVAKDPEALRDLLDADVLPGLEGSRKDTDTLIAMGEDAIKAGETVIERLRHHGPDWDLARVMLSMITIAAYDEMGRRDECRTAERAFVKEFLGSHDWRVDEVAHYYQRDLDQPRL